VCNYEISKIKYLFFRHRYQKFVLVHQFRIKMFFFFESFFFSSCRFEDVDFWQFHHNLTTNYYSIIITIIGENFQNYYNFPKKFQKAIINCFKIIIILCQIYNFLFLLSINQFEFTFWQKKSIYWAKLFLFFVRKY
jgi:hypothetical protein